MILVFLGPPGSGKGTQAKALAEQLEIPHVSLGDILREEVRQGTAIGQRAQALMAAGQLVPDELTIALTEQRTQQADCQAGFILDGYPRSLAQAEALEQMLQQRHWQLDRVVYFAIAPAVVIARLSGRRSCPQCGAVYHLVSSPPRRVEQCDRCGGKLVLRPDDQPAVIEQRFAVYDKQTQPLIARYRQQGKLVELDAAQTIEQVKEQLVKIVADAKVL